MTHLGPRVTPLVDGRLPQDAAERAHVHIAGCATCRETVGAERRVQAALRQAPDPAPSAELVDRLLVLGGPRGPLRPRPGHVPGSPRPAPLPPPGGATGARAPWTSRGPASRDDARGPHAPRARRARRRLRVAAAVSVLSLASVGLLGLLLLGGSLEPRRPLAQGNLAAAAVGPAPPVAVAADPAAGARSVAQLRRAGWAGPERLPGGLVLVRAETAHDAAGAPVVQLTYTDGAHTVVLSQQRGRLDTTEQAGFAPTTVGGSRVHVRGGEPWQVAWQSGGLVLTVTADAPWPLVEAAVAALPHHSPDNDWIDRVTRGATAVTAVLSRP